MTKTTIIAALLMLEAAAIAGTLSAAPTSADVAFSEPYTTNTLSPLTAMSEARNLPSEQFDTI